MLDKMILLGGYSGRDEDDDSCYNPRVGASSRMARKASVSWFSNSPPAKPGLFLWREDTASTTLRQCPSGIQDVGTSSGEKERELVHRGCCQSFSQRDSQAGRMPGSSENCYWWIHPSRLSLTVLPLISGAGNYNSAEGEQTSLLFLSEVA